jgi:hypothetical protein
MKIKVIRDTKISSGWIKTGTDHEAREVGFFPNRRFQIIEGKFQGEFVPENNAIRLPDEPTYSEHQYNALKQNFYETCKQRDKVIKDLATHAQTIVDLQKDKLLLLQQIESEVDKASLVEIPANVAQAINYLREHSFTNEEIYELSTSPNDSAHAKVLNHWSDTGSGDGNILMEALVNGYVIERVPKELLRESIRICLKTWKIGGYPVGTVPDSLLDNLEGIAEGYKLT